eukprot:scaffold7245_cov197-Ochromonas_danica.AAC.18
MDFCFRYPWAASKVMLAPAYLSIKPSQNITVAQIGDHAYDLVAGMAEKVVQHINNNITQRNLPITLALMKIEKNMDVLDNVAVRTPQLTKAELFILLGTVIVSASSPILFQLKVVEVLVPCMAAVAASIGLSSEYVGKVAVSKSKEIAALAIQAAAEAEVLMAEAERAKAILPLCVGIATTASAFALLAPNLLHSLSFFHLSEQLTTQLLLFCPLISVLAAAVAGLATAESRDIASRAAGLGNRRFASSRSVGRTWLSSPEQVELAAQRTTMKWKTFAISVLPAPLIATLTPGLLPFKTIVCAAVAAAQAAYYLAIAEYFLASSVEAVALKARASAVADTYANQSTRAGAILPFTSALASLCAAASAAVVELLPLIGPLELQALVSLIFPSGAALFAAAASVAKARCEVDAVAASEAASKGLSPDGDKQKDPLREVCDHVMITLKVTWQRCVTRYKQLANAFHRGDLQRRTLRHLRSWTSLQHWRRKLSDWRGGRGAGRRMA